VKDVDQSRDQHAPATVHNTRRSALYVAIQRLARDATEYLYDRRLLHRIVLND